MAWVGDHIFSYGQAFAGAMCVACPESPETIVEDRREIAPTYFFAPPRVYENLLTQIMVRMEDAGRLKKGMFHYFLKVARALRREDPRPQARGPQGAAALRARRHLRVRAAAQPHGLLQDPRRLHGRRGHRAGAVPLLPLARHEPEAALRPDRGQRVRHAAAGRRGLCRHRGQAGAGRGDRDRELGRGALSQPRRVPEVLQERRGDRARPRPPTAGCTRAMPASSTSTATSRSSTAPRTWAASTAATCSPPSTSRTR